MTETYLPRASTNISQVDYDSTEKTMTILFKDGSQYRYDGVPQEVFLGIQNAASAGSYFHRQIKDRYPYEAL